MVNRKKVKTDPIILEVMRNALQSVAEEMGVTLLRTAMSPNIKDRRDCSAAIYSKEGLQIAQAEHIPLHLGLMTSVIKATIKVISIENLEPGDSIMINDPFISGSHLPDICIFSPVFWKGKIIALIGNLAHYVDIGGMSSGGMPVNSREIFQEGLRIPPIKIRKKGKIDTDLLKLIKNNVRTPFEFQGDMEAQIAANNVGIARLQELIKKYGEETFEIYLDELMNYSERRIKAKIKDLKKGAYSFTDYLEGETKEDKIAIKVSITIEKESIILDFTGTSPQVKSSLNCTRPVTLACVYYAVKSMLDPTVPSNEGAYRPIKVITPPGTLVNPNFPAAVSNANINTAQRITDVIFGALSKIDLKNSMAACAGTMALVTIGGIDQKTNRYYSYIETQGGGMGAIINKDGMDGVHTNMTNTRNTPIEVIENSYPLLVRKYALRRDTSGAGKFRGGIGLVREIKILNEEANVTLSSERYFLKPWGLAGGKNAEGAKNSIEINGEIKLLPSKITTYIPKNSTVIFETAGGGGYGNPLERDPELVLRDVKWGLVSLEKARSDYGVVIDQRTKKVLVKETKNLRKKMVSLNK